jgi:hypothetical protein
MAIQNSYVHAGGAQRTIKRMYAHNGEQRAILSAYVNNGSTRDVYRYTIAEGTVYIGTGLVSSTTAYGWYGAFFGSGSATFGSVTGDTAVAFYYVGGSFNDTYLELYPETYSSDGFTTARLSVDGGANWTNVVPSGAGWTAVGDVFNMAGNVGQSWNWILQAR